MGRPLHADGRQTRQALLDAALELFARNGYFGTSLRDIATVVGVRESAIYNYFPSKDALFEALIVADYEQRVERFATLVDTPIADAGETLERLAGAVLESFCTPAQQKLFGMLMSDGMRLAREGRINLLDRMATGLTRLRELMQRLMREGWLRRADPEVLAMAFMGPLFVWRHLHAVQPRASVITHRKAFARAHVEQFLRGAAVAVGPTPPPRRVSRPRVRPRPRIRKP